jgi:hypothetical protein
MSLSEGRKSGFRKRPERLRTGNQSRLRRHARASSGLRTRVAAFSMTCV